MKDANRSKNVAIHSSQLCISLEISKQLLTILGFVNALKMKNCMSAFNEEKD
jgi:hypothetical protein